MKVVIQLILFDIRRYRKPNKAEEPVAIIRIHQDATWQSLWSEEPSVSRHRPRVYYTVRLCNASEFAYFTSHLSVAGSITTSWSWLARTYHTPLTITTGTEPPVFLILKFSRALSAPNIEFIYTSKSWDERIKIKRVNRRLTFTKQRKNTLPDEVIRHNLELESLMTIRFESREDTYQNQTNAFDHSVKPLTSAFIAWRKVRRTLSMTPYIYYTLWEYRVLMTSWFNDMYQHWKCMTLNGLPTCEMRTQCAVFALISAWHIRLWWCPRICLDWWKETQTTGHMKESQSNSSSVGDQRKLLHWIRSELAPLGHWHAVMWTNI